jgi:hypothetical protein
MRTILDEHKSPVGTSPNQRQAHTKRDTTTKLHQDEQVPETNNEIELTTQTKQGIISRASGAAREHQSANTDQPSYHAEGRHPMYHRGNNKRQPSEHANGVVHARLSRMTVPFRQAGFETVRVPVRRSRAIGIRDCKTPPQ